MSKGLARRSEDELSVLLSEKVDRKDSEMEAKVRKALSGETVSNADMLRMKSSTATEKSLDEVLADTKGLEDKWEDADAVEVKMFHTWKLGLILLSVLVGGSLWAVWQAANEESVDISAAQKQIDKDRQELELSEENARQMSKNAEDVVMQYVRATTLEEKLALVANVQQVRPYMEVYYNEVPIIPDMDCMVKMAPAEMVGDSEIWFVVVGCKQKKRELKTFFVVNENGQMKVDWEAEVCWQRLPLTDFLTHKHTEGVEFRVRILPAYEDGFYSWGFDDENYRAVRLYIKESNKPDASEKLIWGYVKADSQEYKDIQNHQSEGRKTIASDTSLDDRLIVKIRFLEGTSEYNTNCVLIDEIVSPRWINVKCFSPEKEESNE
eukprot:Seg22395.1 transcript_id=Seg22395.1/GoldUCD/mRNA.D3Y31 product="hypothetical protein" protein_id=Seg22395.1/GoldUCD/D3Y31